MQFKPALRKAAELGIGLITLTTLILAGCGGGASSGGNGDVSSSPAVVLADLRATNLDSQGFPWDGLTFAGVDKRWDITTPIPVQINSDSRATAAMDAIEAKLGMTIFDRTSISGVPAASVTRGIIFSKGTAYVGAPPLQNWCANVSNGPYLSGYPPSFLVQPSSGVISTVLYVNYDSPYCTATSDVAIHELGHALGLGAHFNGFGNGPPISTDFWSVLATLYGNPIGTPTSSIVMKMK
jgi:hypothetical protein